RALPLLAEDERRVGVLVVLLAMLARRIAVRARAERRLEDRAVLAAETQLEARPLLSKPRVLRDPHSAQPPSIFATRRAWRPPSNSVARKTSRISDARPAPTTREPRQRTLASLCLRAIEAL